MAGASSRVKCICAKCQWGRENGVQEVLCPKSGWIRIAESGKPGEGECKWTETAQRKRGYQ